MLLNHFENKLQVVVMGASGGIGEALVAALIAEDKVATIYAASRSAQSIQHDKVIPLLIDFNDESTIIKAVANIKLPLDLVINATGFLHDHSLGLQPEKTYTQINQQNFMHNLMANTLGPALLAKYCLPLLNKQRRSIFAALSARVGSISDNRLGGWYSYRAAKAALNMLIKNFAIEVSRKNKQAVVVGLHPGTVDTDLSKPFQTNVPAGKLFTSAYAAECLLTVIDGLSVDNSGACFAWDGQVIPA